MEEARHMPLEFQRMWNEYVPKHLLPRCMGFELMMAPYAIATEDWAEAIRNGYEL